MLGVLLLLLLLVWVLSNGRLELIRGRLCRAVIRIVRVLLACTEGVILIHVVYTACGNRVSVGGWFAQGLVEVEFRVRWGEMRQEQATLFMGCSWPVKPCPYGKSELK